MNYEQFRAVWYEALTDAGVWSHLFPPTETVDLGNMDRTYQVYVHLQPSQEVRPFHVSARLSWTWDALQAARTTTTEEDALMMFLGDERRYEDTERPWLRVDVTLRATLPRNSTLPLPEPTRWRDWLVDVNERLDPLLATGWEAGDDEMIVLAHRGEPEAEVQPAADGQLSLTGVRLSAWEGINLPRQWDDPFRVRDEHPYDQLAGFIERVWEAMEEWNQSLALLLPPTVSSSRETEL